MMAHGTVMLSLGSAVKRQLGPLDTQRCPVTVFAMGLGERIREARAAKGLSQRELAVKAGVSAGQIGHLEKGSRDNPERETSVAIAAALEVGVEWLLTGNNPRVPHEDLVDAGDPYPARAAAITRMRGLVSEQAIATVRADHNLGTLTEAEWVEELLRADRLARKGLERHDGQPHVGDGPVGRPSKIKRRT